MSLELQIIRLQEFIRLGPTGKFDLKASKAALATLAAACLKRGIHQALVDLRALQPNEKPVFSPQDLVSLVNTFHEAGFTSRHRLAVLYTVDPYERARMFASLARLRGWKVKAFADFEEAVVWLAGAALAESTAQPAVSTTGTRIPVCEGKYPGGSSPVTAVVQPVIKKRPLPGPKTYPATARPAPLAAEGFPAGLRTPPAVHIPVPQLYLSSPASAERLSARAAGFRPDRRWSAR